MKFFIKLAQLYIPGFYKRQIFKKLVQLTARAFQCPPPEVTEFSVQQSLPKYAEFTRAEAEKIIQQNQKALAIREKLFQEALELGSYLRKKFFIKTTDEALQFARILYRQIEIDFHDEGNGKIKVSHCYFSMYYSRQVCELISGLDEGIIAGLCGGGNLKFQQRITDGSTCCQAIFLK